MQQRSTSHMLDQYMLVIYMLVLNLASSTPPQPW
jgi:hypothetical protein